MSKQPKTQEDVSASEADRKATGTFRWSHVHGEIIADTIIAEWRDGAWLIYASKGDIYLAHYQQFHLRIPAESPTTPIEHQFIAQPGTPEPGFIYFYSWNKPVQHNDFDAIRLNVEGYVHVRFIPSSKTFDGRFYYMTPRQSNLDLEGDGTYDFTAE